MTSSTVLNNNFGLTEHEFDTLRLQLSEGDDSLFERIILAQFESCLRYLQRQYKLPYEKAYDVSMDALLAFRRRLVEGKIRYGNLRFLFTQQASHIYLKEIGRAPSVEKQKAAQSFLMQPTFELDEDERVQISQAWNKARRPMQKPLAPSLLRQCSDKRHS